MKLPFSTDQFLDNFSRYNNDIWPVQSLFYLLAAAAVFFSLSDSKASNRIIALILSFFWLWMG